MPRVFLIVKIKKSKWWKIVKQHFETELLRLQALLKAQQAQIDKKSELESVSELLRTQRKKNELKARQYAQLVRTAEFLVKLHSCPASSASIERIFSVFGLIWTKLRNKLGDEKVEKLVKIYKYLNLKGNRN